MGGKGKRPRRIFTNPEGPYTFRFYFARIKAGGAGLGKRINKEGRALAQQRERVSPNERTLAKLNEFGHGGEIFVPIAPNS